MSSLGAADVWRARSSYLVAFTQGAAIMVIEVLGARMLTPYFGTSHFVWAAQIMVTLLALTLGYALGAKLGSSSLRSTLVPLCLGVAAVSTAATPLVVHTVARWCYRTTLPVGATIASAVLFGLPLTSLASLSPVLVGQVANRESNAAGPAGRVAAVASFGSVLGVALVAFWLIPSFPTSTTMYAVAAALLSCAAVSAVPGRSVAGLCLAGSALLTLAATSAANPRAVVTENFAEVDRQQSAYATLQVWKDRREPRLALSSNYVFQNYYNLADAEGSDSYTYVLAELAMRYAPQLRRGIVVGLGVGIVPRVFRRAGVATDVLELDAGIAELAEKHFGASSSDFSLHIGDARMAFERFPHSADLLVLDAFQGDTTPSHLLSREAFEAMKATLVDGGVLVANFSTAPWQANPLRPVLLRTIHAVFAHLRVFDAGLGNYFVVASDAGIREQARVLKPAVKSARILEEVAATVASGSAVAKSTGLILTDDYNPADQLVARISEAERRVSAAALMAR